MRQFVLSFEAEEDILRIFEYGLANFGLFQAEKYYDMLFECFKKIGSNPFLFPAANEIKKEYRYCVCGVDTIYFKVENDDLVEIVTLIGRQDFPK